MPLDKDKIDIGARLFAIEYMIANAHRLIYRALGKSDEEILSGHDATAAILRAQALAISPEPTLADHVSDEALQHVKRLLAGIEAQLGLQRPPPAQDG